MATVRLIMQKAGNVGPRFKESKVLEYFLAFGPVVEASLAENQVVF